MELYNKRLIKILNLLLKSKKKITGEQIGLSVGVSSRTVRNDIKELNSILKGYDAEIVSEIGQGYSLHINDEAIFSEWLNRLNKKEQGKAFQHIIPSEPKDRVHYIVSKLLLASLNNGEKIDFYDIEDELFISTSTLKKDLRSIDKILKDYDLRVSITKKKGVRIVGEETKIRYCISEYIFNGQGSFGNPENKFYKEIFSSGEIESMESILMKVIHEYDMRLTDIAYKNLLVHSLIMLKRFEHEKLVEYEESDIEEFVQTTEFQCAKSIIQNIKETMNLDLGNEVYYLTQHLISSQRFLIADPEEDYEYKEEIQTILQKIKQGTNIDLSDDKQLINGLAMHLEAALQRLRFDMNIRNEFLDSIKNTYPLAFELAVLAGEVIEQNHQLRAKENELGFLAIHFGAALERKGLNKKRKRKKAIIVCIAGMATAMLLKEKIQQNFGHKIEVVKTCPSQNVTKELIDSVDLVLTTVELPDFHSNKIRKIHLFLKDADLEEIGRAIDEAEEFTKRIDYKDIFREELFFENQDVKDKQEAMEYITNVMLEKGYITEDVKQSIFKREEMATTELGSLVAIPHALLNDMKEAVVSVMILRKPIRWDNEKVQVILLLNIPQSKYDVWENTFKNLYEYLIGNKGVSKLIKNRNYQEFIDDLYEIDGKNRARIRRI